MLTGEGSRKSRKNQITSMTDAYIVIDEARVELEGLTALRFDILARESHEAVVNDQISFLKSGLTPKNH